MIAAAARWIAATSPEQPWFGYVQIPRPHTPYETPPDFSNAFEGVDVQSLIGGDAFTNRESRRMEETKEASRTYDANLLYADFLVSELIARLTEMGRMKDTVVVMTSDHVESFWEHGRSGHSHFLHEHLLHVPLVIRLPEAMGIAPRIVDAPVQLVDLSPTLTEIFGLKPPDGLEGHSL
jgi:arylsulfatase A-like enzyme